MDAVIFDMDGTLADVSLIRHHLKAVKPNGKPDKDFTRFHEEGVNVPPHQWVVDAAREYHEKGIAVLIVTARKRMWEKHTSWFLALHDIPSDDMFMRGNKDNRPDYELKKDILEMIRFQGYNVIHAYDDNPAVIRLWQEEGIPTTIVPGWEDQ